MDKVVELVKKGLYGENVDQVIATMRRIEKKNLTIWFVADRVLSAIAKEWEQEIQTVERANAIDQSFKEPLVKVLENLHSEHLDAVRSHLDLLIKRFVVEYGER